MIIQKMKISLAFCVIMAAIFLMNEPIFCQDGDSLVSGKTVDGNVVSVDVQNSKVSVKAYEVMAFSVPSSAKIVNSDGFDIKLSDVTTGNYVTVDYHDANGLHIMDGMEVAYNQ